MKKLIFFFILILSLSLVSAGDIIFRKGDIADLKINCDNAGYYCSGSAKCNLTVFFPNGTVLINNRQMSNQASYHNFTLTDENLSTMGRYRGIIMCRDGVVNGTNEITFLVNARGEESTTADSLMYLGGISLLILFMILCIVGFTRAEKPAGKLLFAYGVYILLIGISYILWLTTENILSTSIILSRIFYWIFLILMFGFFPMVLTSFVWYIWLLVNLKQIRTMIEKGVPENEAYERSMRNNKFKLGGFKK